MRREDVPSAMLLAAGVGSRLDPLTRQLPKPMVPFVNRPVMEHILQLLRKHGIKNVVANVHHLAHHVCSYFDDGSRWSLATKFVREEQLSGDAGGVRACREHLADGRFIVLMGDLITDMDISYVIGQHCDKGAIATIALKQVSDVQRFGVACLDDSGLITGFQEKPKAEEARSNLASTGVYVFEPEIFEYLDGDEQLGFGAQIFPRLIEDGLPVLGLETWGYWSDIGTIDQYKQSTWDALAGLIDVDIAGTAFGNGWIGEGSEIDDGAQVDGIAVIGIGSRLEAGVRLSGNVVIGDHCTIKCGAILNNSIVWSGSTVGANSFINNSVIGSACSIARGTYLNGASIVEPHISRVSQRPSDEADAQPVAHSFGVPDNVNEVELEADR